MQWAALRRTMPQLYYKHMDRCSTASKDTGLTLSGMGFARKMRKRADGTESAVVRS
jgi:hypothetical protein